MTRKEFLYAIQICGNREKPASERWKDIVYFTMRGRRAVLNFRKKLRKNEIVFIDKNIYTNGETKRLTGFYILEKIHTQVSFTGETVITFIDIEDVVSVTFENTNNITKLSEYFDSFETSYNVLLSDNDLILISYNGFLLISESHVGGD